MSKTAASLLLVLALVGLGIYLFIDPPPGFDSGLYRVVLPFVLLACAVNIFENIRTRAHMSQIIGALRATMARQGQPPSPAVKAEAIEILLQALRSQDQNAARTAARQLENLTGKSFGFEPDQWEAWWAENKARFKRSGS